MNQTYRCNVEDWGLIDYDKALTQQKVLVQKVINAEVQRLVFCEHPTVLTLGRMTKAENLLLSQEEILTKGIHVLPVDRGGDITLHAPGQLVIYPIFNLNNYGRDLKLYFEKLEDVVIDLLKEFDILARGIDGQRGVWVEKDKIASMGVGVRKWVTYHGIGLNINTDLSMFRMIRPCGLNVQMTSLSKLKKQTVDLQLIKQRLIKIFVKQFQLTLQNDDSHYSS